MLIIALGMGIRLGFLYFARKFSIAEDETLDFANGYVKLDEKNGIFLLFVSFITRNRAAAQNSTKKKQVR